MGKDSRLRAVAVLCALFGLTSATGCIGSTGKPVDWFVAYKLPKIEGSTKLIRAGVAHVYLDVDNPKWVLSDTPVNVSNQAIGFTLNQIYKGPKRDDITYLMYNDESPDGSVHENRGHLKGVVAFDDKHGFWLVHSVPKFPPMAKDGYDYPESGHYFGQTFLCISLDGSYFNKIAKQLLVSWPYVFDFNIPQSSRYSKDRDLQSVVKGKHNKLHTSVYSLPTLHSQTFISLSKNKYWGQDLYTDLVAPHFKSSLYTETWQNGSEDMHSNCTTVYKVENIRDIALPFSINFSDTKDHAKWAVTSSKGVQWICIGDINRQVSQKHRGGGTVCTNHTALWKAFNDAIEKYEPCPGDSQKMHQEKNERLKFEPGHL
ncbi:plancitoxin-1-like [Lineus longissimus]|uniref:plancitoxin-1-like n=1 Tax=Lineus longissimus TaxID=88925 RepID=UPI002B4F0E32